MRPWYQNPVPLRHSGASPTPGLFRITLRYPGSCTISQRSAALGSSGLFFESGLVGFHWPCLAIDNFLGPSTAGTHNLSVFHVRSVDNLQDVAGCSLCHDLGIDLGFDFVAISG